MKRWDCLFAVLLLGLTACGGEAKREAALPVQESVPVTETASPTGGIAGRAETFPESTVVHFFDECGALDEGTAALYSRYLAWVSATRLVKASAVVTADLGTQSPEAFAEARYRELWGEEPNGFLLLVNNDTGQDYVYRAGSCLTDMSDGDIALAIAQATPALIEKRYGDALEVLLPLGETLPDTIFDRSGTLSPEQQTALSRKAAELSKKTCIYLTKSAPVPTEPPPETPETTEETIPGTTDAAEGALAVRAQAMQEETGAAAWLLIDTGTGRCALAGEVPETLFPAVRTALTEKGAYEAAVAFLDALA